MEKYWVVHIIAPRATDLRAEDFQSMCSSGTTGKINLDFWTRGVSSWTGTETNIFGGGYTPSLECFHWVFFLWST